MDWEQFFKVVIVAVKVREVAAAGVSLQVLLVRGLCSEGDPRLSTGLRISVPLLLVQEGGVLRHGDGRDSHKVRKILCLKILGALKKYPTKNI